MKNLGIAAFAVTMVLYLWFPANMIFSTQNILKNGIAYRFALEPIDPYDVFRGYYVALNYNNPLLSVSDSTAPFRPIYVKIGERADGFAYFESVSLQKPKNQDYVKTEVNYYANGKIRLEIPEGMRYYYLNKKSASQVEQAMALLSQSDSSRNRAYVDVRIRKGKVVLEQLYINDKPVKSYLKSK